MGFTRERLNTRWKNENEQVAKEALNDQTEVSKDYDEGTSEHLHKKINSRTRILSRHP